MLVHTFLMLLDLFSNIDALRALLVKCIDEVYPLPQWLKLRKGFYFTIHPPAQSGPKVEEHFYNFFFHVVLVVKLYVFENL